MDIDIDNADRLLTTTRSVRKRLDLERPVEPEVVERCIEIALQAPTGSNEQRWHFLVVTDAQKRKALAGLYLKEFHAYRAYREKNPPRYQAGDPRATQATKVTESAAYLAENLHKVPVLIISCYEGRVEREGVASQASFYGSILPATWSLMLALRARGLGSVLTTFHLSHEKEVERLLGIPSNVTQAALLPVAYVKGADLKPAKRLPASGLTYWNEWGKTR